MGLDMYIRRGLPDPEPTSDNFDEWQRWNETTTWRGPDAKRIKAELKKAVQ